MNDFIIQTFHRLIAEVSVEHKRFLFDQIDLESRLLGIVGPRGVGKTTLLLQLIKEKLYQTHKAFYFSADNAYLSQTTLLSFVDELYQEMGIRHFFIDEVHKYPNWSQELKNIYDSFPDAKVIFSGSSSIDLVTGAYDLSRRAVLKHLPGLSFREYLNITTSSQFDVVTPDALLNDYLEFSARLSELPTILNHFQEYMHFGYYPIIFEGQENLYETLAIVVEKTIFEDIANFYNLKTGNLHNFKRILNFLASIPPGKIKAGNIAKHLQIDFKTAEHYLYILEKTGLTHQLYPKAHGNQVLSKPNKIYFSNTTLLSAMNNFLSNDLDLGSMRETFLMQSVSAAGLDIFHSDKGDFYFADTELEVGGKNKSWTQLKDVKHEKRLVKDGILSGINGVIPLYLFGFLY